MIKKVGLYINITKKILDIANFYNMLNIKI